MALNGSLYSLGNMMIILLITLTMASALIHFPAYWKQIASYAVFVFIAVFFSLR